MTHVIRTTSKKLLAGAISLSLANTAIGQEPDYTISLSMNETPLSEVMNMISMQERVNILMSEDIDAAVSFNLYDVTVDQAIESVASAAGYAVERRGDSYFIIERDDAGRYTTSDLTQVRTYKLEYADPADAETMLTPYLSEYGTLSVLTERRLITIEDAPDFLSRFDALIRDIDHEPTQILIEAKILEITLTSEDSFGIDWSDLFTIGDASGSFGTRGLSSAGSAGSTGFFLTLEGPQIELLFNALEARGQVRTLSTPKLLAVENQEASVIVGDRRGYLVTTTINQVTSESIEFLESGVILRVTPFVDRDGNVRLEVHPEVSTGSVDTFGIPSQVTTEVTTQLVVPSGRTVFIGGLIKHGSSLGQNGVPVLRRVPGIRRLFSNEERVEANNETIVLITPHIVTDFEGTWNQDAVERIQEADAAVDAAVERIEADVNRFNRSRSTTATSSDGADSGGAEE